MSRERGVLDEWYEEGQKDKVAWCYDRETLKTKGSDFEFHPGFNWRVLSSDVALTCWVSRSRVP